MAEMDDRLRRIEALSDELRRLIQHAQTLEVPAPLGLRAPTLEGLQTQIRRAKRILGESE